jgi:hypothetical protein
MYAQECHTRFALLHYVACGLSHSCICSSFKIHSVVDMHLHPSTRRTESMVGMHANTHSPVAEVEIEDDCENLIDDCEDM